jgi:hypothetical protein
MFDGDGAKITNDYNRGGGGGGQDTRKNTMCSHFQKGSCNKGDRCPYSHGSGGNRAVGGNGGGNVENEIKCKNWSMLGVCKHGDSCKFVSSHTEKNKNSAVKAGAIGPIKGL